ncbi:MAG: ribonuclease P protein component, partial [Candidatus Acidiferrales bacterium]
KCLRNAARKGATVSHASDLPPLGLPRACRLVRRAEYDAVYREGRRKPGREFAVFLRPNGLDLSRFGWSIKKTLGGAVRRNRIRRRIREIIRLHRQEIAPGWDIVIHPRSSTATADFTLVSEELLKMLPRQRPPASATA